MDPGDADGSILTPSDGPTRAGRDYSRVEFRRLTQVSPQAIIALMNDRAVRRHLPLARGDFGPANCEQFVAAKERMWEQHGYGPWAFVLDDEFIGWGGLQPEGHDVDLGLVLRQTHWGAGRVLYRRIIAHAFGELGMSSITILLPPSRMLRLSAIRRLGFRPDGQVRLEHERFLRYRLTPANSTARRSSIEGGVRVAAVGDIDQAATGTQISKPPSPVRPSNR